MSPVVNVAGHLSARAAADPGRAALVVPGRGGASEVVTYAELHAEVEALAGGFTARGAGRGVRVAVMVPPGRAFVAVTFALLRAGAVPVLVDPGMGVRGVGRCLADADPGAFVGVPKAHVARRLFGWARGVRLTVNAGRGRFFCHAALAEVGAAAGAFAPPNVDADDTAAVLFTSGSTGPAKGAVYTHGIFAAQVESLRTVYGIHPGEVDLCTFPLFALFGPALGMTSVVPRMNPARPAHADPRTLCAQMNEWRVTNFFGSPAVLRNWAGHAELCPKVPTLRRVISAGAPATADVVATVAEQLPDGAEVFTPYGATEALPVANVGSREIVAVTRALTEAGRGVCVGRPVPGVTVRVIRQTPDALPAWDESLTLPAGEIGEFVVRGPVVTREYYNRPDATRLAKVAHPDGTVWHRTGDVGYFDDSGRMWFCGRKAHVVWTPAGPVYPDQVEPVLNPAAGVARTALVGVTRGGVTHPVVCVEPDLSTEFLAMGGDVLSAVRERALGFAHTRGVAAFLEHPGFPVDVRHNSKIFREKLAAWADKRLGPRWRPEPPR